MVRIVSSVLIAASLLSAPAFADLPYRGEIRVGYDAGHVKKGDVAVKIDQGDLDLSRTEDASKLFMRIKVASRQVCRQIADTQRVSQLETYRTCRDQAIGKAVRLVGSDNLNALHAAYADARTQVAQR